MGTPVHAIQVESLFFLNKETKSSLEMPNVKLTYFNLRGRGEPCRIMLAYGNYIQPVLSFTKPIFVMKL